MDDSIASRVAASRQPFDAGRLTRELTAPVGPLSRVFVVSTSASTNTDVVDALRGGADWPHMSALVADWQTAGRGRAGRAWVTTPGTALTVSFVARPGEVAKERIGWVPLVAGLAVVRALTDFGMTPRLKWPNDVIVEDPNHHPLPGWGTSRKIAGVLCEAVGEAVVIGVGVNVSQGVEELPVVHGASLAMMGASRLDREELLGAIATELASICREWGTDGGQAKLTNDITRVCDTIGKEIAVDRPGAPSLMGRAVGLSIEGGLLVESASGRVETVLAGDVSLRAS